MYMEHMTGKQDCKYGDESHAHGVELCTAGGCRVCNDGEFVEAETSTPIGGVYFDPGNRNAWPLEPEVPLDCRYT